MQLERTRAAKELEKPQNLDPHKLISLLMAGTLERVEQAKQSIQDNNLEEKKILMHKIIAIINGLRESLDFERGGDIAVNLDSLYDYMLAKLNTTENSEQEERVLTEVKALMEEVKTGWDGIVVEAA